MSEQSSSSPAFANPEVAQTPELLLTQLIDRVDEALTRGGVPPRLERRWGWCNIVPDALGYSARHEGYMAATYQVKKMHETAAGIPPPPEFSDDEPYEVFLAAATAYTDGLSETEKQVAELAFSHGFSIVTIQGAPFMVDLTFSQFMGEDGFIKAGPPEHTPRSGRTTDDPLAQRLYYQGYAPLTSETLSDYLRLTTAMSDPTYINDVTIELLERITPSSTNTDAQLEQDGIVPDYPKDSTGLNGEALA